MLAALHVLFILSTFASISQSYHLFPVRGLKDVPNQDFGIQSLRKIATRLSILRLSGNSLQVAEVPRHIDFATEDSVNQAIPTITTTNITTSRKYIPVYTEEDENPPPVVQKTTPVEEFFRDITATASLSKASKTKLKTLLKDPLYRLKLLGNETMSTARVPHPKAEPWRFTNLRRFFENALLTNEPQSSDIHPPQWNARELNQIKSYLSHYIDPSCDRSHIVILNGRVEPLLSNFTNIPEQIQVTSYLQGHLSGNNPLISQDPSSPSTPSIHTITSDKKKKNLFEKLFHEIPDSNVHPFKSYGSDILTALNLLKMQDFLYLHVPRSSRDDTPIQILSVNLDRPLSSSSNTDKEFRERLSFPRVAVYVGNHSTLNLKQSLVSLPEDILTNDAYQSLSSKEIYNLAVSYKDNRLVKGDGDSRQKKNHLWHVGKRLLTANLAVKEDDIRYSFVGGFTKVYAASKAKVKHVFLQEYAQNVRAYDVISVDCCNESRYDFFPVQLGSDSHRLNFHHTLREKGSNLTFGGATLADTAQALDIHSTVLHNSSYTTCDQNHRVLVGEKGYTVFKGILIMPTFASKADGSQVSKAFLLGNESRVHLMPFLDLNCGDIKCTHGAAVGDLNPNDLFYLSTRGISAEIARPLLTKSFVFETIHPAMDDPLFARRLAFKMTRLSAGIENDDDLSDSADVFLDNKQIRAIFEAKKQKKGKKE